MLYRNLSGYFREKYGRRLTKICIDAGFSCPNRDGVCGVGGCIFCSERGSGEHIEALSGVGEQVRRAIDEAKEDELFVAYFQNFSGTYAPLEILKKRYDEALISERIKVLAIATRPDCIDEGVAELIASYKKERDVWVELGLQTASDETAKIINRGYETSVFTRAVKILEKYEIPVVVHLIVGLPGEGLSEIKRTTEYISTLPVWGVKIHSIYVAKGTRLATMYERGEYEPPTQSEYTRSAVYILTHLPREVVIHRLTGDAPKDSLLAPEWNKDKHRVIEALTKEMQEKGFTQGCFFEK